MIPMRVTEESSTPVAELGQRQWQRNPATGLHCQYQYVKAPAAITKYDLCMAVPVEDGDCDVAAASLKQVIDATKSWTVDEWTNYLVTIIDGATIYGETLRVASNTATILSLAPLRTGGTKEFSAAQATTHRYSIHQPYFAAKTSGAAVHSAGVAPIGVTLGYYFWMQKKGRVIVNFIGTSDPSVLGEVVVPSATAGSAKGMDVTTPTAVEAGLGAGVRPAGVVAVAGQCIIDIDL